MMTDARSISFHNKGQPGITFDGRRVEHGNFHRRWNVATQIDPTTLHRPSLDVRKHDSMIHSSNVKYIKRSASSRVSSDNAHRPGEHLPVMRRLYKDLKSTGRRNNFGRGRRKSKDKTNEPHVTPNRSSTKTSNKIVADGIATTCSENTDDAISFLTTKDCLRFDQGTPDEKPSLALYPRKLFDDDGGVEEEEDSLLGLQFLTDDDDDVHDAMIFAHDEIKVLLPSLTMSSSFCLSSDTDE